MNNVVFLGLSGGVDSAVSAKLLSQSGHDLSCIYMNCFQLQEGCATDIDAKVALQVASNLGSKFEAWDFRKDYEERVLQEFFSEYQAGRTPNPDIACNGEVKFGAFARRVLGVNKNAKIATGHYVRVGELGVAIDSYSLTLPLEFIKKYSENYFLFSSLDVSKDQSYFLYQIYRNAALLPSLIFPVGNRLKAEVRALAERYIPLVASKPDSQGICFVGNVKLRDFLSSHIKSETGEVVDVRGRVIGTHRGAWFHTVGQRHGFDLSVYTDEPLYVLSKDVVNNRLVVGSRGMVYKDSFVVEGAIFPYDVLSYLSGYSGKSLSVRIRHLGKKVPCSIKVLGDSIEVKLSVPEFGLAPGQSAVFYFGDLMLGGGVISSA